MITRALKVDNYHKIALVGVGGMGKVYRALDYSNRVVALKEIRLDGIGLDQQSEMLKMIEREIEAMRKADHSAFPKLYDHFRDGDIYYLAMEFIEGKTLSDLVAQNGPFTDDQVKKVAIDLLAAIQSLHHLGFVYRDMKPSNIMIDGSGRTRIVDLGIAKKIVESSQTAIGSAGYAPPEQYNGEADQRSDIYAVGKTMCFLLSGREPKTFELDGFKMPDVQSRLLSVINKAIQLHPKDRYQLAGAMMRDLEQFETKKEIMERRRIEEAQRAQVEKEKKETMEEELREWQAREKFLWQAQARRQAQTEREKIEEELRRQAQTEREKIEEELRRQARAEEEKIKEELAARSLGEIMQAVYDRLDHGRYFLNGNTICEYKHSWLDHLFGNEFAIKAERTGAGIVDCYVYAAWSTERIVREELKLSGIKARFFTS